MRVADLMTQDVLVVSPGTALKEAAALLVARGISGLPVCDGDRRVLGVVSEADIVWKTQGYPPERRRFLHWFIDHAGDDQTRLDARDAGSAMTAPALTIAPGADVTTAARLMVTKRVNRLPVVDDDGRLVGIITRADLVRAFNRPDAEIEAEILDQVLIRTMWIDPKAVELRVEDGDVVLTGQVETRSAAEIVESYIRRVPGVVAVSCVLTWSVDDRSRQASHSL